MFLEFTTAPKKINLLAPRGEGANPKTAFQMATRV